MYLPGFLIPADLDRMIPEDANPLAWAETNLQASPGAMVMKDGRKFRIPTLVMASKEDGSCIYFEKRRCGIWENSPFGCAFFGCDAGMEKEQLQLSHKGLVEVFKVIGDPQSLYSRIWEHLWLTGHQAEAPEVKRKRMNE